MKQRDLILIDLDATLVDRDAVLKQSAHDIATEHHEPDLATWLVAFDCDDGMVRQRAAFLAGVTLDRVGQLYCQTCSLLGLPCGDPVPSVCQ